MEIQQYTGIICEEVKRSINVIDGERGLPFVYAYDPNSVSNWIIRNLYSDSQLEALTEDQAREGIRCFMKGLGFCSWEKSTWEYGAPLIDLSVCYGRKPSFQIPGKEWLKELPKKTG